MASAYIGSKPPITVFMSEVRGELTAFSENSLSVDIDRFRYVPSL